MKLYSYIFLLTIIAISLSLKKENVLMVILALLPFHSLLKPTFALIDSNQVMAVWKELAILILAIRSFFAANSAENNRPYVFPFLGVATFIFICFLYFINSDNQVDSLLSVKMFVTPFLYGYCCYKISLSEAASNKLLTVIIISALLAFSIGHIQQYLLKAEFAFFMGIADYTSGDEIVYFASANKIMGLERMYGAFVGPNEFGMYCSMILLLVTNRLLQMNTIETNLILKYLFIFTAVLAFATLLQTFSRVSWAFTVIGLLFLFLNSKKSIVYSKLITLFSFFIFTISLLTYILPEINEVATSSAKLEEASAIDRPREFIEGFARILEEPLGDGLGKVVYSSKSQLFHTEIFWWILFLECGWLGGLIYIGNMVLICLRIYALKAENKINIFSLPALAISGAFILTGFASAILLDPIILTFMWVILGLGINPSIQSGTDLAII